MYGSVLMLSNDAAIAADRTSAKGPIGVFDSGLGGLTVVAALRKQLPGESILYLGDTARVPYGTRSGAVVRRYAQSAAEFLLAKGAKMLVVACNTASAHALADLQSSLDVPVVGVIEAGATAAARAIETGAVGVMATESTVHSQAYQRAMARLAPHLSVRMQAAPLLVPLAEEGLLNHPATHLLLEEYIRPLLREPIKALVLGCTHYPLFLPLWQEHCGHSIAIIDSASAVASVVARSLAEARLEAPSPNTLARAPLSIFVTDVTARFKRTAPLFLGGPAPEVTLVDL